MKNNIIGFIVYFLASLVFSPAVAVILLAIKENSDRCHYYGGTWNKTDIAIGIVSILLGTISRMLILNFIDI